MIVFVPGYEGSGEGHWQRILLEELEHSGTPALFPTLPDLLAPEKDRWVDAIHACLPHSEDSRVTFVCHSLGCWAVDHLLAERRPPQVHAVLLVAPPSPFLLFEAVQSFLPPPLSAEAWAPIAARSMLVGSDDDDYADTDEHAEIARTLGIKHHPISGAGHITAATGYGPWPLPRQWLADVGALDAPPSQGGPA